MGAPINFSHRTVQRGVAQPAAVFQSPLVPRILPPTRVPVGTTIDLAQINAALVVNQPPPLPSQFGDLHAVVQDQWISPRKLALPADVPPFGLWLRTVEMPRVDGTSWYLSVLAAVPAFAGLRRDTPAFAGLRRDTPATSGHWPSAEKRQYADVVAVSYGSDPLLLGGIRVFHSGSRYGVEYAARNPDTGAFDRRRATVVDGPAQCDRAHDARLVGGLSRTANVLQEHRAIASALYCVHQAYAPAQEIAASALEQFFALAGGPLIYENLILLQTPPRRDVLLPRYRSEVFAAEQGLAPLVTPPRLDATEFAFLEAQYATLDHGYEAFWDQLATDGGPAVQTLDFTGALAGIDNPAQRRALYHQWLEKFEHHFRQPGQLFESATIVNDVVIRSEHNDFAEMRFVEQFGLSLDDFFTVTQQVLAATEPAARRFVQLLRDEQRIDPTVGDPLMLHDVPYLMRRWLERHGGAAPRAIAFSQALETVERLFADMGFAVHQSPAKDVTIDAGEREGKWNAGPLTLASGPHRSFVTFQPPDGRFDLEAIKVFAHEFSHAMHFQTAQQTAHGLLAVKAVDVVPGDWLEGVGVQIEQLWDHPGIARRYLGGYAGFTEKYIQAHAALMQQYHIWNLRRDLLIALQEIMLYREERPGSDDPMPFEDRLRLWHEWVPKYLFVETDPSVAVGEWALKPHVSTSNLLLSYAAYPLGVVRTQPLFDRHIRRGTTRELQRLGADLRRLFRKGSMVTPDDLTAMGLRLPAAT